MAKLMRIQTVLVNNTGRKGSRSRELIISGIPPSGIKLKAHRDSYTFQGHLETVLENNPELNSLAMLVDRGDLIIRHLREADDGRLVPVEMVPPKTPPAPPQTVPHEGASLQVDDVSSTDEPGEPAGAPQAIDSGPRGVDLADDSPDSEVPSGPPLEEDEGSPPEPLEGPPVPSEEGSPGTAGPAAVPPAEPADEGASPAEKGSEAPDGPSAAPSEQKPESGVSSPRKGPLVDATDSAKKAARKLKVDLRQVEGTGKDGRVTQGDVQRYHKGTGQNSAQNEPGKAPAKKGNEILGPSPSI